MGAWTDARARPRPPHLRLSGVSGSEVPGGTGNRTGLRLWDSASVRQPRPLSWQQAVAGATSATFTPPSWSQPLLWATRCAGSHARPRPLPVQAPGKGKEGTEVSGIGFLEALEGGGVPWDETWSWNPPPALALRRRKAETTTPSMPRGGWQVPIRDHTAQGADGSWSSLLFGWLDGCTGWVWGD